MTFPIVAANGPSGYNLTRSVRLRSSASAYFSRTPASAGNRSTWTWSGWVKKGILSVQQVVFSAGTDVNCIYIDGGDGTIGVDGVYNGSRCLRYTTAVFRDPSAWYHIVVALDTTQATDSNRIKLYVNGSQVSLPTATVGTWPAQNSTAGINNNVAHSIGRRQNIPDSYYDGYVTEVNFIDGQALTPSSFGSTNALTGVWQPAKFTGTYGTNGFYLNFTDNSGATATTIGKDYSGNGNNWTPNNISVTSGVTYDSMTDVPTLTSATAANYCVANPVNAPTNSAITNGNLTVDGGTSAQYSFAQSTFNLTSGSFYFEATLSTSTTYSNALGLLLPTLSKDLTAPLTAGVYAISWSNNNQIQSITNGGSATTVSTTNWANGDVIQVAYNATNGKIWFGRNGTWYPATNGGTVGDPAAGTNQTVTGVSGLTPTAINYGNGTKWDLNFGQRPFAYTPPTGFVALNTYNLPTSTIVKGNTVMDATLYSGNGTSTGNTQVITNTAGFKPDLVWIKARNSSTPFHILNDSVRGTNKILYSNSTDVENSVSNVFNSFNSNGFTVDYNSGFSQTVTNANGQTYVGWQWQAGQGTTSSNTSGSITSTVSVNASAGFSVVTWTGNGSNATIGHGLGVAPSMVIVKNRSATSDWLVQNAYLTSYAYALVLSGTNAQNTNANWWNSTAPTSTVFSVGNGSIAVNGNGNSMVAYCWTPIAGYSAFGSLTGNGSSDGPFVYTGFRPKFILFKNASAVASWWIFDTVRNTYNVADLGLRPNTSDAESTFSTFDILSNGFKVRTSDSGLNGSGNTVIYAAFAENPFKNALAR